MQVSEYIIQCQNDDNLLWNNLDGWIEGLNNADYFNEMEKESLNLPIEGKWIEPSQYFKRG
jgi:hypothetical protein